MPRSKKGAPTGPRPVRRFVLKNGLTVLIAVNRSAPLAEILLHVNTGYCWEPDRYQGLSHVVEHNLMQASAKRPTRTDVSMARRTLGAFYDAGTGYDFTEYLLMVKPAFLEDAMELLSDAFFHPVFREDTFRSEMGAILQESRRKEDLPKPMALEKLYEAAFRVGRRRRWRLGTEEGLGRLRVEDLRTYFKDRYGPGNIVLAVGGNVDPDRVARAVRRIFGKVPAAPVRGAFEDPEPEQRGVRYLELEKAVGSVYWRAGFHAPPFLHPDWYPVKVLSAVLGSGRGARLPGLLKDERGLADGIAAFAPDHDEYGMMVLEMETDAKRLEAAEEALFEELARIRRGGVTAEELDRARAILESAYLRDLSDLRHQLDWLALYEFRAGGFRNASAHLEKLFRVKPKDLRRTAEKVLHPKNLSICAVLPEACPEAGRRAADIEKTVTRVEARVMVGDTGYGRDDAPRKREPAKPALGAIRRPGTPRSESLDGGGTLLVRPDRNLPVFSAAVLFRGGRGVEDPQEAGLTAVMQGAMLRGAYGLSGKEIALKFESMGVVVEPARTADAFGWFLEGPSTSFASALDLMGGILAEPHFEADDVKRARLEAIGRARAAQDNPRAWVMETFETNLFRGHPYGNPPGGDPKAMRSLKPEDVAAWHRKSVGRASLVVAVGGDVTAKKAQGATEGGFGGLRKGKKAKVPAWKAPKGKRTRTVSRNLRQTATAIGFPAVPATHADFEAMDVLAWMSRGDGGRFYDEIRAKRGLAYIVHAWNLAHGKGGGFMGFTATAPESAKEAERILLEEFTRFATEPPGKEELARTQRLTLGMRALRLRTPSATLRDMALGEATGVPLERWLSYEKAVKAVTSDDIARLARKHFKPESRVKVQIKGKASTS